MRRRAASPRRRRSAASSPWSAPRASRKASSASAMTSTMALPMRARRGGGAVIGSISFLREKARRLAACGRGAASLPRRDAAAMIAPCAAYRPCRRSCCSPPAPPTPAARAAPRRSRHAARAAGARRPDRPDRGRADPALRQPGAAGPRRAPGLKLQFRGQACVLDAYLYPPPSGRASSGSPTSIPGCRSGDDTTQASCIAALAAAPEAAPSPMRRLRRPPGRDRPDAAARAEPAPRRRCCPRRSGNCGSSGCGRCA